MSEPMTHRYKRYSSDLLGEGGNPQSTFTIYLHNLISTIKTIKSNKTAINQAHFWASRRGAREGRRTMVSRVTHTFDVHRYQARVSSRNGETLSLSLSASLCLMWSGNKKREKEKE